VPLLAHPGPHVAGVTLRPDRALGDGDVVNLGAHALTVAATPGHTTDMLSFVIAGDTRAVVGDTIFPGGPGRTWTAEGFQATLGTLRRILAWPDEMVCYPGHGPAFRLGDVRADIEAFLARDHGTFFGEATWEMG
jgi:glyoxylase-like metal-dependent hydrolase (beta-lactamase superfamily II)